MKTSSPINRFVVAPMGYLAGAMIVLLPFHAFLTVWASSIVGHYTLLRLWKEFALLGLVVGGLAVLVAASGKRPNWSRVLQAVRRQPIVVLIVAYLILLIGMGLAAVVSDDVTRKAFAYGLLLDGRFLVFFLATWLISLRSDWLLEHWRQLLLIPAGIVVLFGILQFTILPTDFLRHFGYGPGTIDFVQTVDQKAGYQRVQSTLRGANPLGAYLGLVISALGILIIQMRSRQVGARLKQWHYAVFLLASCVVLMLTFSRSAWIGALAAVGWLIWQTISAAHVRRHLLIGASVAFVLFAAVSFSLRNNDIFQNTILHTDEHSRSAASSNEGHLGAVRQGLRDIEHQPQGRGTGTAGPASVYNGSRPPRIAENYYLQIGQEVGVVGIGLFVVINLLVGRALWFRRDAALAQVLLASLIGLSLVNLLSHAWTDDTLSYVWWGLAGVALGLPIAAKQTSGRKQSKKTAQ